MVDCNKQATGKKGPDRKAFMKECLGAAPAGATAAAPAMTTQQTKMKDCNKQAAGKKGDGAQDLHEGMPDRASFLIYPSRGACLAHARQAPPPRIGREIAVI